MESQAEHGKRIDGDDDARDITAALGGDGDAYARIIRRHERFVATRMWRFTRDRADHAELVQEVFVQAFFSLAGYRGDAPFEHWLSKIATRTGYKLWKKADRAGAAEPWPHEALESLAVVEPEELEPAQAAETLFKLLERLSPRDRLVLTLRYVEDRSVEETAELTGWSATMVKVQAWRARKKLRKMLISAGVEVSP